AQVGRIEAADKGTLFLDEIDSMSPGVQVKLLRVLEERTLMSGGEPYPVDIRVIAASKRDLESAARDGAFRSDLFYRLNVVRLRMPPLRERREDVLPLFVHFLSERKHAQEIDTYAVSDRVRQHLLEHDWPGNVRELRNFAFSTLVDAPDIASTATPSPQSLTDRVDAFEAALIREALRESRGNVSEVIARLATPRKTLYGKFKRFNIDPAAYR
ncbi:MAG TPA: Fis family transcriptional regulator, partial [Brevundimonas sp.]|nr:Fis family transcriptional regulator [Brevundimonas sp.]